MASDAHKEAVAGLKRSCESDDKSNVCQCKASKGKRKKMASKDTKKMFTEIRLVAILPYGLDTDGSLNHTIESLPPQINKLVELGFAKIGRRGVLKFGNELDMQILDDWLHETLPIAFEHIEALPAAFEDEYAWRLFKTSRSHFELHRERPDGYDAMSAKGKSKGWQDSKLFFVTRLPILTITDALDGVSVHSHKGKGKAVAHKRSATEAYSDDDNRKLRKDSAKSTVRKGSVVDEDEHIYVVDSDSDEAAISHKSHEVKPISTPTLEAQFEDLEASIVGFHKRRHGFSSPPPTNVNLWSTKPDTVA
ncbi:hypothetical protein K439DRAFT_1619675 [Ramaria rubella]|nr:hypothetical protein K439DRAFT_1619675 [Ramaria rubella]